MVSYHIKSIKKGTMQVSYDSIPELKFKKQQIL